jgi:hypothetical protein
VVIYSFTCAVFSSRELFEKDFQGSCISTLISNATPWLQALLGDINCRRRRNDLRPARRVEPIFSPNASREDPASTRAFATP